MTKHSTAQHICFVHFSVDEHLGCFHVFTIVNSAAVNIRVHDVHMLLFWPCPEACRISALQPGIKATPYAVESRRPKQWTTLEVLACTFLSQSLLWEPSPRCQFYSTGMRVCLDHFLPVLTPHWPGSGLQVPLCLRHQDSQVMT